MDRRTLFKITAATLLGGTIANAYDKKLIVNTIDMKINDPKNPTKAELKHSPEIKLAGKDAKGFTLVEVTVGQDDIIHPSTANHWIYEIELYADGKKIASASLEPEISRGYLSARVDLSNVKTLSSIAKCNLHGNYTASIDI